jgi:hypothetical protein
MLADAAQGVKLQTFSTPVMRLGADPIVRKRASGRVPGKHAASGTRDVGADSRPPSDRPASQSIEPLPHTRDVQGAKQSRGYPRGTERERSPEQPGPKGNAQTPIPNSRNEQSSPALTVEDTVG